MSPETETTIAAQATPAGNGGLHVLRLSGPASREILRRLFVPRAGNFEDFVPWKLHHGLLRGPEGTPVDDGLCVFMPGPRTFTGEDCAEIHCHGGQTVAQILLSACFAAGAEPAGRGEFSRRAFLNGRMDLSQAEAVAELIAAPCREAAEQSLRRLSGELGRRVAALKAPLEDLRVQMSLAVDFPEDEVEILPREAFLARVEEAQSALEDLLRGAARGRILRLGARVVLAGPVNAGKSSLMNAILGRGRALVTEVPGTTRDFLEESALLEDLPVRLVDTAGLRRPDDAVEALGIERSREQIAGADCLLAVADGGALGPEGARARTCPDPVLADILARADPEKPLLLLWNKADLCRPSAPPPWCRLDGREIPFLCVSARTGEGLDTACRRVRDLVLGDLPPDSEGVAPNGRPAEALRRAAGELRTLAGDIAGGQLYDLLSVDLDSVCGCLDEVTGLGSPQDVLNRVFASFCIGK